MEVDKLPDFVFLSKDLMNIPLQELKDAELLKIFVERELLYQKQLK